VNHCRGGNGLDELGEVETGYSDESNNDSSSVEVVGREQGRDERVVEGGEIRPVERRDGTDTETCDTRYPSEETRGMSSKWDAPVMDPVKMANLTLSGAILRFGVSDGCRVAQDERLTRSSN
jgi:hypothetical protein